MDLNTVWFLLFGVLLAGYAVLDGFDLGVGMLSLFGRSDDERRLHLNAIGPVWDGNEVWLLTAGGALFAAFPAVYATAFSAFYLAFMLLLLFLIARAVAFEFRSKVASPAWRRFWDLAFGLGSLVPSLLYGVAVGNVLRGLPLREDGYSSVAFFELLNPQALLVGFVTLSMFLAHGAAYLAMKTEGSLQARCRRFALGGWAAWTALWAGATATFLSGSPHLFIGLLANPVFWVLAVPVLCGLAAFPILVRKGRDGLAFLASSVAMVGQLGLAATSLYPRLIPDLANPDRGLTIHNAASSPLTLTVMLWIAGLGMPVVIGYTIYIHRVFRGKVRITPDSY